MRKNYFVYLLLISIITGSFLRFYNLSDKELWLDEVYEVDMAKKADSLPDLLASFKTNILAVHPPISHSLRYLSMKLGRNEFFARLPSALFGIFSLVVIYFLGSSLFGYEVGLLSLFLLSISPFHVFYSQEARPYAILTFFAILSFLFLFLALTKTENRKTLWLCYVISTALMCYSHYFSFLVIAIESVIFIIIYLMSMSSITFRAFKLRQMMEYSLSLFLVFLLYLPWIPTFLTHYKIHNQVGLPGPNVTLNFVYNAFKNVISGNEICFYAYMFLFFTSIFLFFREKKKELIISIAWIFLSFVFVLSLLVYVKSFFHPRYLNFMLPIFIVLVSRGVCNLVKAVKTFFPQHFIGKNVTFLWSVIIVFFLLVNLEGLKKYYNTPKRPWRDIVSNLSTVVYSGDILLTDPHYLRHPLLYYLSAKDVYSDPARVMLNNIPITIASHFLLENRKVISVNQRMIYLTEKTNVPSWVKLNFDLDHSYYGLMGNIYVYVNFNRLLKN